MPRSMNGCPVPNTTIPPEQRFDKIPTSPPVKIDAISVTNKLQAPQKPSSYKDSVGPSTGDDVGDSGDEVNKASGITAKSRTPSQAINPQNICSPANYTYYDKSADTKDSSA